MATMRILKKTGMALLSLLLMLTMLNGATTDVKAAQTTAAGFIVGTYRYAPSANSDKDLTDGFIYSDRYFAGSAKDADPHLATISLALASSSACSLGADYVDQARNLTGFLKQLGFSDCEVNQDYRTRPTESSLGLAAGHKTIRTASGTYTLLVLVPRSAGYGREWSNNFDIGTGHEHAGFAQGADAMLDFAAGYVARHKLKGAVKVWLTGYSRGAAVVNLAAAALDDDVRRLGIKIAAADVYAYTFESPRTVMVSAIARPKRYTNIHNYVSDNDIVTMIAPAAWGFGRYGTDIALPVHDAALKPMMLAFLKQTNPGMYDSLTAADETSDPDTYHAKKLSLSSSSYPDDTAADRLAEDTQAAYGQGRWDFLAATIVPDQAAYAARYQAMLQHELGLMMSLTGDQLTAFSAAMTGTDGSMTWLALSLYYTSLRSGSKYAASNLVMAQSYLKALLTAALKAAGCDDAAIADATAPAMLDPLTDVLCFLLFGSGRETKETLDTVHQLNMAVTLIGNMGRITTAHRYEYNLSWLRTQDTYYTVGLPSAVEAKASPAQAGTIKGAGIVEQGHDITLTAQPAAGYRFVRWTEGGQSLSTTATVMLKDVTTDHALTAVFERQTFAITAAADDPAAGTVTGMATVAYGQALTLTAQPTAGYRLSSWTEDGQVIGTDPTLTLAAVSASHDIVAVFTKMTYQVTATASPAQGGSADGGGTFEYGQVLTLTAKAADGYRFVRWTEDGRSVATTEKMTVSALDANHGYVAEFVPMTAPATPAANLGMAAIIIGLAVLALLALWIILAVRRRRRHN